LHGVFAGLTASGGLVVRVRDKNGSFGQRANQQMRQRVERLASASFGPV
jgi:hypothetical protein